MISTFRKLISLVTPRRKASRIALVVVGVWWVAMMVRGVRMALPEGLSTSSPERGVARLELLTDITYQLDGVQRTEQVIFDRVLQMIDRPHARRRRGTCR